MLNKYHTLALASVLAIGTLGMAGGSASAAAIPLVNQYSDDGGGLKQDVKHRRGHNNVHRWDRARHGNRCRYRNCGGRYYRHYHDGYYYSTPWWTLAVPLVVGSAIVAGSYGDSHIAWCHDHYRSYNPRNNTWIAYSGDVRVCVSPY